MVNIKISETRRREIATEYYDRLIKWIKSHKMWSIADDTNANAMMSYIHEHSREIFLSSASCLKTKSKLFSLRFAIEKNEYDEASSKDKPTTSYGRFVKQMRRIYNGFMQAKDCEDLKNGYWLMKKLGVKVCPYCNNNYIFTISKRNIKVRPEFDHFLPEALHPSLILSFYNLVPSCPQCNHLKKVQELDVNPWVGYEEGKGPSFRVDTSKENFPAKPVIIIDGENENTRKLGIRELYNEQTDYVKDILNKIQAYNPATYRAIVKDFQGIVHTEEDLNRIIWGNYIELSGTDKRPLAKLTRDILEQYKKYF